MARHGELTDADVDDAVAIVSGLTVRFGAMQVLSEVDLRVGRGEVVAIAGENGAGKTTLLRCLVGDLEPDGGEVAVTGDRVGGFRSMARRRSVGVVWQTAAQCDNLDVASNLLLGRERRWVMRPESRRHAAAAAILADLDLPPLETSQPMHALPRSQRQLVAIAQAAAAHPSLLVLDEPTGALGVTETLIAERLITRLHREGCTVVMVTHDVKQMLRLADRIVVLRRGRVTGHVNDPAIAHPDDIAALMAGQEVESSARRQLVRLQGLVDRLSLADPSSGVPLILTALGAALGADRLCFHRPDGDDMVLAWSLGLSGDEQTAIGRVSCGASGGPVGRAAATGEPVIDLDGRLRDSAGWPVSVDGGKPRACYAVPVVGSAECLGVVTVFHADPGAPAQDELDLVGLYAGYVAGAVERQSAESARQEAATARRGRQMQRQFLSRLSHELRTPLTAIRGYASSLAQPDVEWEASEQQRFLGHISDESERLGRLVGDLLDYSAIESGLLRLNWDWCELPVVLDAARACFSPDVAEWITISCAAGVPAIWADHDRLEQVLVNLIDNALRHNPPGTRVTVEARSEGGSVVMTVADDGIGLPPGAVFDDAPGARRSSTSGSGLGLSIARGIIDAHHGDLRAIPARRGACLRAVLREFPAGDAVAGVDGDAAQHPADYAGQRAATYGGGQ